MTSRYDDLSDRARWFLNNFDEVDLAGICAAHEASSQTREAAIGRVRTLATRLEEFAEIALKNDDRQLYTAIATDLRKCIAPAAEPDTRYAQAVADVQSSGPAARHDDGPSIAEAAADDQAYWTQKHAGE